MKHNFKTFKTPLQVAQAIAEEFLKISLKAKDEGKDVHISLSGGSTPSLLFKLLAKERYLEEIQWSALHFWWGDERLVPHGDSQSNYGEAFRTLFSHPSIPSQNIHPVDTEVSQEESLQKYAQEMQAHLSQTNGLPSFDWMILGMGTDGHTASLFPQELKKHLENPKLTELVFHPESKQPRLSLTSKVLLNSKRLSFLVTGEAKAPLIKAIRDEENEAQKWPAFYMKDLAEQCEWYIDEPAGSQL